MSNKTYEQISAGVTQIKNAGKKENTKERIGDQFQDTLDYAKDVADRTTDLEHQLDESDVTLNGVEDKQINADEFTELGWYSEEGVFIANNNRRTTDFIRVFVGEKIQFRYGNSYSGYLSVVFFDRYKNPVLSKSYSGSSYTIVVDESISYVRATISASNVDAYLFISGIESDFEIAKSIILSEFSNKDIIFVDGKNIIDTTGKLKDNSSYKYTDFIIVNGGKLELAGFQGSLSVACVAFYDYKKTYLADESIIGSSAIKSSMFVPKDAAYVRFCSELDSNPVIRVLDIKDIISKDEPEPEKQDVSADYVMVKKGVTTADYISYFEEIKGSEDGLVISTTGALKDSTDYVRTAFVSLEDVVQVMVNNHSGTSAGCAFYTDKDKSSYISGFNYSRNDSWVDVPEGAKYIRCSCHKDDERLFLVRKLLYHTLADELSKPTKLVPRHTRVVSGQEGFVCNDGNPLLSRKRIVISGTTEDKQVIFGYEYNVNRYDYKVSVHVNATSKIGVGSYQPHSRITNEIVAYDNTFEIYCGSGGEDTTESKDITLVFSDALPFNITVGNDYIIGIRRYDASIDDGAFKDGETFYIIDCTSNIVYEKFVDRAEPASEYNGIRGGIVAHGEGKPYVSVKSGDVTINNIVLSSDYNPQAKAIIFGDSFLGGDTLSTTGQKDKYSALIQQEVGKDDFVLCGLGGERLNDNFYDNIFVNTIKSCAPDYCIIALGTNNAEINGYKRIMQKCITFLEQHLIVPILVTITPRQTDKYKSFRLEANDWVRNLGYRYVDICKAVTQDGNDSVWIDGYVRDDDVHPTIEGHRAIFEAFKKELPELFEL